MSRSRKHVPIRGLVPVPSERPEKLRWHRRMRRIERQRLAVLPPDALDTLDGYLTTLVHDVSADEALAKRGKRFVRDPGEATLARRK